MYLAFSSLHLLGFCRQMGHVSPSVATSTSNMILKSGCLRKPGKMLKMLMEGGQQNKLILDRLGGVMDKYNKRRFCTALVLEILASLYLTPSDAIFVSKF